VSAPLTIGTAGHIDHGKSALVQALTGAGTDRLPEEQRRGMTIALGYSQLTLPGGRALSMIDVPGHERLVRTMVAGASGIDMFLLTVAADDGVMPQTREHVRVLRALAVRDGVIAITKADLADPGPAEREAAELLPAVPVVSCSARTGLGVEALIDDIEGVAGGLAPRAERPGETVLHVDRVFTIHGAGTVVTGTLWSGAIATGERLRLLPSGREARVRAVQVHDRGTQRAQAGQRVAVNLAGIGREVLERGDVLAGPGGETAATFRLDLALELDSEPQSRVHVHHGTRDVPARLVHLGEELWQARLERELIARRGDRVVLRSVAPVDTLGGGIVLDARPARHGGSPEVVAALRDGPRAAQESARQTGARRSGRKRAPQADEPPPLSAEALALEERLRAAGTEPPSERELGAAAAHLPDLRTAGRAVRVGRSMYAHPEAIERLTERVTEMVDRDGAVTVASLRDELGGSRRYAQALLEHLDAARVTRRLPDDRRVLRRADAPQRTPASFPGPGQG
jgi:selenocysteine-specific elongation factor